MVERVPVIIKVRWNVQATGEAIRPATASPAQAAGQAITRDHLLTRVILLATRTHLQEEAALQHLPTRRQAEVLLVQKVIRPAGVPTEAQEAIHHLLQGAADLQAEVPAVIPAAHGLPAAATQEGHDHQAADLRVPVVEEGDST